MSRYIDLSHTIHDGLVTYKGLPPPHVCDFLSREASRGVYTGGTTFQIGRIEMVTNTGTYVDCPFHRFAEGKDTSEVPLDRFVDLPGVLVRAPWRAGLVVDAHPFQSTDVKGKAVLVHTGWSEHFGTDRYFSNHPFLSEDAAVDLRDRGALLVGIDSHNIDDTREANSRPVHTTLLGAEILIVEHLRGLGELAGLEFKFSAAPPKFRGVGTLPVRAYATLQNQDASCARR
jgi:arylformamidase